VCLAAVVLACLGLCVERFHKNLYRQGVIVLSCGWLALIVSLAAVGLTKMRYVWVWYAGLAVLEAVCSTGLIQVLAQSSSRALSTALLP
jgi:hypothetical protein